VPLVTFNISDKQTIHQSISITDGSNFYDAMVSGADFTPATKGEVEGELNALRGASEDIKEDIVRSYLRSVDLEERINVVGASFGVFEKWFTDKKYDQAKAKIKEYEDLVKDPNFGIQKAYKILEGLTSVLNKQYREEFEERLENFNSSRYYEESEPSRN
jgi:hypothetical protein